MPQNRRENVAKPKNLRIAPYPLMREFITNKDSGIVNSLRSSKRWMIFSICIAVGTWMGLLEVFTIDKLYCLIETIGSFVFFLHSTILKPLSSPTPCSWWSPTKHELPTSILEIGCYLKAWFCLYRLLWKLISRVPIRLFLDFSPKCIMLCFFILTFNKFILSFKQLILKNTYFFSLLFDKTMIVDTS